MGIFNRHIEPDDPNATDRDGNVERTVGRPAEPFAKGLPHRWMVIDISRHDEKRTTEALEPLTHGPIAPLEVLLGQVAADDQGVRLHRPEPAQHLVQPLEPIARAIGMDIAELRDDHCGCGRTSARTERGPTSARPLAMLTAASGSESMPTAQSPSGNLAETGSIRRLNHTRTSSSL